MRKATKNIAHEMGLQPISLWTAIKLRLRGIHVGFCCGVVKEKGVRAVIRK